MDIPAIDTTKALDSEQSEAIRKAARGLEAVLIREWVGAMERAQLESGMLGKGTGSGTRSTTFHLMLSDALAAEEPFGVANQIAEELSRLREAHSPADLARRYLDLVDRANLSESDLLTTQVQPLLADETGGEK